MDHSDSTGFLVNKLAHAIATDMDRRLKAYDVTISQYVLLKQLWWQEGRSQVELQDLLGLEGATITGLVQRMARQGLIQSKPDPSDKRVQRVFLTRRGRELEQIATALEAEVHARALEGFTADEKTFFNRLLARALYNCKKG